MATRIVDVAEQKRLNDAREAGIPWKKWGPYLSERQQVPAARVPRLCTLSLASIGCTVTAPRSCSLPKTRAMRSACVYQLIAPRWVTPHQSPRTPHHQSRCAAGAIAA